MFYPTTIKNKPSSTTVLTICIYLSRPPPCYSRTHITKPCCPHPLLFRLRCQTRIFERLLTPVFAWKTLKWLNVGSEKVFKKDIQLIDDYCAQVIRKRQEGSDEVVRAHPDLLSQHIIHSRDHKTVVTDKYLRDVVRTAVG